jgi:hypothetical protein
MKETVIDFSHIYTITAMLFCIYILVLLAILADLWSGLRKAKRRCEIRSSFGFKRTVDKLARYYNALFALTIIDIMQMIAVWYLDTFYGYMIPLIPFISILGAIGIGMIEIKSIFEKAEDKAQFAHIGDLAGRIIANKDDLTEIGKAIADYMTEKDVKEKEKDLITKN